jgi:hypothetical protein
MGFVVGVDIIPPTGSADSAEGVVDLGAGYCIF